MNVIKILLIVICVFMQGCALFRSVEGPMSLVNDKLECDIPPKTLLVLLPGAYDVPQDFIDQNFVREVRKRNVYADIQIVDAHIGYYTKRQIVKRLEDEIVSPAKIKGYDNIWFAGISLGGYGTLLYSKSNPTALEGVFLMAPYLGENEWARVVQNQGGLKKWSSNPTDDVDGSLWRWLQSYANQSTDKLPIYVGFGSSDRFAQANGLLADVLPKERSMVIPGGHDWKTWLALWTNFLDISPLPRFDRHLSNCKTP
jgi:hypothetical protein